MSADVTRLLLPVVPAIEVEIPREQAASLNNLNAVVASDTFRVIVGVCVVPDSVGLAATRVADGAAVSMTIDLLVARLPTNPDVGRVNVALLPRASRIDPPLRERADELR